MHGFIQKRKDNLRKTQKKKFGTKEDRIQKRKEKALDHLRF